MKREPNISRLDYGRTHGWWVRFQRGEREGKRRVIQKSFSDRLYGGKRKALAAAIAWRDRAAPGLPAKLRQRERVPPGYGYVKRTEVLRRVERHPVYVGWIRLDGGRCSSTTWSVTRWGELGAKQKCQRWLARHRRELRKRQPKER